MKYNYSMITRIMELNCGNPVKTKQNAYNKIVNFLKFNK